MSGHTGPCLQPPASGRHRPPVQSTRYTRMHAWARSRVGLRYCARRRDGLRSSRSCGQTSACRLHADRQAGANNLVGCAEGIAARGRRAARAEGGGRKATMDASMNEASNLCFITSSRSSVALVTPSTRHSDRDRAGKSSKCISVTAVSAPSSPMTASLSTMDTEVKKVTTIKVLWVPPPLLHASDAPLSVCC